MGDKQTQCDGRPNIEAMVREALARLAAEGVERSHAPAMPHATPRPNARITDAPAKSNAARQPADGNVPSRGEKLAITERLVTSATLVGRLSGVRQCVVPSRAVVTPAAKDLLRDRKVTLTFADTDASEPPAKSIGEARRLTLVAADGKFDPAPLAAALSREGRKIGSIAKTELLAAIDAASALVKAVANGNTDVALLFTREAPAAVCLANRIGGVRAVAAASTQDAKSAVRSVGANMLIIDPAEKSFWELLRMAAAFAAAEARECPAPWKARLG